MNDNEKNVFLTLTHYSINEIKSPWYISSKDLSNNLIEHNTGIGNILFQIASALNFAHIHNAKLYVPSLNTYLQNENLEKNKTIFRYINTEITENYDENKIIKFPGNKKYIYHIKFFNNIHIENYFENVDNFDSFKENILNFFRPNKLDIQYLTNNYNILNNKNNLCSIHVRRGRDYCKIFNKKTLNYIDNITFKMIDYMIENKKITNFFVLTNDKKHCKQIFNENKKYSNINFYYSNERDFYDIWIISIIKNNIVSCSTLSWWGSYLNINKDKYIIYTKYNLKYDTQPYKEWIFVK